MSEPSITGPTQEVLGLSSMATKHLLTELAQRAQVALGLQVRFESGGGVEVVRRLRAGEGPDADLAVLASAAVGGLAADGLVVADSVRPLFVSQVCVAVPEGSAIATLDTENELRALLLEARRIAYSTGPSGTALLELLDRWGLDEMLASRLLQAPTGVPVGSLVVGGEAELGFQQQSELLGVPGLRVLGPLPGEAAIASTFTGVVLTESAHHDRATAVLEFLGSARAAPSILAHGMVPAQG